MNLNRGKMALLAALSALLAFPLVIVQASQNTPPVSPAAVSPAATSQATMSQTQTPEARLPGRTVRINGLRVSLVSHSARETVNFTVTLVNTGTASFQAAPEDFMLSAEGDIFGQVSPPTPAGTLTGPVAPHGSRAGRLTFVIPTAAFPRAAMLYRPKHERLATSIPLSQVGASAQSFTSGAGALSAAATTTSNTLEDTFTRPDQTGWGSATNSDGAPTMTWGLDGDGSHSYVTISNNTGRYGYPGGINQIGITSAGATTYNGGDALARVSLSAVGHGTPYLSLNACPDKSCYYGARLHTSQNTFELARRIGGGTGIVASATFTAKAGAFYWIRINFDPTTKVLSGKIWPDGASEPSAWTLQWTNTGGQLAANPPGAGGSWDVQGPGEYFTYTCYAFSSDPGVPAQPFGSGSGTPAPTATATATASATATPTLTPAPSATATLPPSTGNTLEDTFTRPDQTGWGSATNSDGAPTMTWGLDGDGSHSYVTISNNTGRYGYPGGINQIGIASAGATAYNGGDALARFTVSAVGHVTPYVVMNACANKSCYYGARLHTSQNRLELAKRSGNNTNILAAVAFTASANTIYWMRLNVVPGNGSDTLQAKIWADGSAEPANWMVSVTDSNSPLAANLTGTGGSWDQTGTGESINYTCYAYAATGMAAPCGGATPSPTPSPSSTPAPNPTSSPSPTSTPSPTPAPGAITEYPLSGGEGDPWGAATDGAGNTWFAEPGCDFAPTCSSGTPPGQIGELPAGASTPVFYTLPSITGNQPIFVALDGSGNVWFTTPNNSMIGEFSPATRQFVGQWPVTPGSGPWDLTFNQGKIWYTEHLVSSVGVFDPATHSYQDFATPSANSNPYGIAANDPVNGNLVWFTENNSNVARIAVINVTTHAIAEYPIRASLQYADLTPHLLSLDAQGNPWWTEGWVRAVGALQVSQATPGQCGASSGECAGVSEYNLPAPPSGCNSSHTSGIAVQGGGQLIWLDDSLSAQVGSYNPATAAFTLYDLSNCNAHPHDGLSLDPSSNVWWDEEFANALGELSQ